MEISYRSIEHPNPEGAPVTEEPQLRKAQKLIYRSFGIIEESKLEEGNKVLNTDYSAWKLAKKASNGSTGWAVFNMIGDLFKRAFNNTIGQLTGEVNTLVGDAKSMQELIKNPVEATEAVKYLAQLNLDKNVRIDLSQYRENQLKYAEGKGDDKSIQDLNLQLALKEEEVHKGAYFVDKFGEKAAKNLVNKYEGYQKSLEQLYKGYQKSLEQLEIAIREVSSLAGSFEAQKQVVAALTYNIAQKAGIIEENGVVNDEQRINFLIDQMQSLWVKSAPSGSDTPIAITKFADQIAQDFNAATTDSFVEIKSSVHSMATMFADSQITHQGAGKVNSEGAEIFYFDQVVELAEKIEVQIWDTLKANSTFISKLRTQILKLTEEHTNLHAAPSVIERESNKVQDQLQAISKRANGELSVGTLFSKRLHLLTGGKGETSMPHEMFGVLRELENGSSTLDATKALHLMGMPTSVKDEPVLKVLQEKLGTTDSIADAILKNAHGTADERTINVQQAVLDPSLNTAQRIQMVEILAQDPNTNTRAHEDFSRATAEALLENLDEGTNKVNVEKAFISLLSTTAVDTEATRTGKSDSEARKSLFKTFFNYASVGGVMDQYRGLIRFTRLHHGSKAVEEFDAESRQNGIQNVKAQLKSLSDLVRSGATENPTSEETKNQEDFKKRIGLFEAKDIDTSEIDKRFNLPMKKYYDMISTAFGLDDPIVNRGDATAVAYILKFLNKNKEYSKEFSKNELAAYLMITEGNISFEKFTKLKKDHSEIDGVNNKLITLLGPAAFEKAHTSLVMNKKIVIDFKKFNEDQLQDIKTNFYTAQNVFKRKIDEINQPLYMIEKGDIEGLKNAAAEDAKGLPLRIARQLGLHEDKTVEHTRFTQKTRSIEGYINPITQALNDLSDPSKEATALQKLQAMKQQANVQKEPVVDPTIAAIFANGYANSEQQPATADDGAVSSSGRTSSLDSLGPNSEY